MVRSARTDDGARMRTLWGRRRGGAHAQMACAHTAQPPAAHAELAANGVVPCAPGRAPRSTAAAWDKGTAW